jgi:hypothetical protein
MSILKMICGVCCLFFSLVRAASASPPNDPCQLPQDLQQIVTEKYPGARLVRLAALKSDDRRFFQTDHGNACPGLVSVDFYGDGKPTVALVLVAGDGPTEVAKLVVAHRVTDRWRASLLETAMLSVPVVWSQPPGRYDDVYGNKTIQATRPVIVFCGYESWSIVYAWKGDYVDKVWLSD